MTRDKTRKLRTPRRAISSGPHTGTRGILQRQVSVRPRALPSMSSPPFTAGLREPARGGYPIPELRGILRRSQRALNRHFSHVLPPSAASAPHAHCRPLRHPVNLCPIVITSCQRSLAFGKVRDAKTRCSPDTIGSGKRRAFPSGQPRPIPVCCGAARLYSAILVVLSGPARAVSSPARAGCF